MRPDNSYLLRESASPLAVNKVLRNTYWLLSMTLLFSAITAYVAMISNVAPLNPLITFLGMMGLLFLTQALANTAWGLLSVFAFTGFMGYTLAPLLNFYLVNFTNGGQIIMTALGGTGIIFLALSAYVMQSRKDFSYMGGFLFVGLIVVLLATLASLFFSIPALQLFISAAMILIVSGLILFDTSNIIHGGQNNYILATIALYISMLNLFINLLHLLAVFSGRKE